VTAAIERLGGLDILVTNSGGPDKIGFDDATLEQFDETYELVVKSVIAAIDAALPALKDGGGAITNIIAASVQQPDANHILANTVRPSIYGAREVTLTSTQTTEYESTTSVRRKSDRPRHGERPDDAYRSIRRRTRPLVREAREEYIAQIIPRGTYGELEEFGKAVAYVSSDVASHTTGHSLNVDGGWVRSAF